jgi:hypothetical protein
MVVYYTKKTDEHERRAELVSVSVVYYLTADAETSSA